MTKKDFELIARAISKMPVGETTRQIAARTFARELAGTNPRFDRGKFIEAAMATPPGGAE